MQYWPNYWLISLSVMSSSFHPYCFIMQKFLLSKSWIIVCCKNILHFHDPFFVGGDLSCFHFLAIMSSAIMNMRVLVFLWDSDFNHYIMFFIVLKSILSDVSITIPFPFWIPLACNSLQLPFAHNIFFPFLYFQDIVFLSLK